MKTIKIIALVLLVVLLSVFAVGCINNDSTNMDKWNAMVTYETIKPNSCEITYMDLLSSQFPRPYSLDADNLTGFISFLKESKLSFDEVNYTEEDKSATLNGYYSVHMAHYSGDDYNSATDKIDLFFVVGKNGYVYLSLPKESDKTTIKSTAPIDLNAFIEYYESAK